MKKIYSVSILVLPILILLIGSASALTLIEGTFMGLDIASVSEVHAMLSVGLSMIGIARLGRKKLAKQTISLSK
ncbi:MAG: hypothetical protein KJ737_13985 [Proteobacteria bacterium]|nr:hypothetical protein [Pseudomonadota bacterium]